MPKRLIDTELWNNEQIVEEFTCDDKYFWLYLLTSPHGSICGVMRYSPAIIGRDMGLHKDTIENLVYRFENNYKLIVVDKETKELLILNWYKWNWSTSGKLLQSVINSKETIKSVFIQELVQERIDFVTGKTDRVSIPYAYPTISNTITNTNNIDNSICKENYNKRNENIVQPSFLANDENQVQNEKVDLETVTPTSTSSLIATNEQPSSQQKANKETDTETKIEQVINFFDKTYSLYPRKVSRGRAQTTFIHKVFARDYTESRKRALYIYKCLERQIVEWSNEGNGKGRGKDFMPYMSSWLNDNFEDVPKKERGKIK